MKNAFFLDKVKLESTCINKHVQDLKKNVYSFIPESKCLGCPISGGIGGDVVAECCRRASPPLYLVEFIYVYQHIKKNWNKDQKKDLIFKCFRAVLDKNTEKPCVLLDEENNKCTVYSHRWTNCRTYGLIPDTEWINRAKQWVKEVLSPNFTVKKKIKEKKTSKLDGVDSFVFVEKEVVDEDMLNKYVEDELFAGKFDPDKINQILVDKWKVNSFKVYNQCKNIELKKPFLALDKVYSNLKAIEKSFVGYDIDKDQYNSSYLAFHIYMLLFTIGERRLNYLIEIREKWPQEAKEDFLEDIKKNLDNIIIDN